ncbi:MAG: prepilin-type N-terminal cleavage/methylation domain-containing protein [Planctomycetes bacterium]|nr:prepilin-type N-terminal cleavage/methylation domain-containing protein [Planctomycetota bacterium]
MHTPTPACRSEISPHARTWIRPAFTLIELLVVIAIVAVLLSILLPSLSAARDSARTIKCQTSLRQMGVGFLSYAGSNRGSYCSGPQDGRINNNWGPPADIQSGKVGWMSDAVQGGYFVPGANLCPTNPARSAQSLQNDKLPASFKGITATAPKRLAMFNAGYNTNYTPTWYFAFTELVDLRDNPDIDVKRPYFDSKRTRQAAKGTLNEKDLGRVPTNMVPLFADGRVNDAGDGESTVLVGTETFRVVKHLTDGYAGAPVDGFFGKQSWSDLGPAHGRAPGGKLRNSASGINQKDLDKYYGNWLFADGHVESLRDSNMDGEFGWLDGSTFTGDDPYDDQDVERKVFGGHLTSGRFGPDPTKVRSPAQ